jgi:hypothetical protein
MSFGGCWVFQKLKEKKQKPLFEALEKMKEGRAQKLRLLLHG